jgi:hypothetical protein
MLTLAPSPRLLRLLLASSLVAVGAAAQAPGEPGEPAPTEPMAPVAGQRGGPVPAERAAIQDAATLTVEEAVALAWGNSRLLQSLGTMVEIQEYRRTASWIGNPELRVRNLSTRSMDEDFDELQVGVRWRPPAPGEVDEERQQDQVRLWERRVEARRAKDWLASRVRRACADVIMYRELVRLASHRVDSEVRRIAQIETMVQLGRRSIVYYTKAKMTVSDARNEHARRLRALRDEERRLQRLTGAASPIDVVVEPLPEVGGPQDALQAIACAHRPEVQLVEARQQLAVRRQERKRGQRWPQLSFVELSRHREQGAGAWHELMFGVDVPLFGRNGGRSKAASLGIARKETQSLAIRERIEDEVHDTFSAYNEARLAWQLARDDGQLMISEAERVIAHASAHHTVPADEVLELERAILDTRVMVVERRRELAHAICFLYYALGIDEPAQAVSPPAH